MAILFLDGFDKYGPTGQAAPTIATLLTAGEWNNSSGSSTMTVVAPLSSTGQALSISVLVSSPNYVSKTLAANYTRLIGGVRFASTMASNKGLVSFRDSSTAQCTIVLNSAGTIALYNGSVNGTVIATTSASVSVNSTHYLEWDITFGAAGAYQLWLDGTSVLSGTGNTKTTANSYANSFVLGDIYGPGTSNTTHTYDDLYLFDSSGATCNAVLLNNPLVETAFPSADTATKQWTNGASIIGSDNSVTATTTAPGANFLFARVFTAAANMTLASISCVPQATSGAAKFKPVLYGAPTAAGAHRYWRCNVNTTGGGACILEEIQFRTVAGTPLLFSGGTASASTVSNGAAANAADNNTATIWGATTSAGWWQYDYGSGVTIAIAEVALTGHTTITSSPVNWDLQWSDDNVLWNGVANFNSATWSSGQTQLFQIASRSLTPGAEGSTLIAQGAEVTGTTSGTTLTAPLTASQSLTGGTQYVIGFVTDTSIALAQTDTALSGIKVTNTYTAGVPTGLPLMTTSVASWQLWGNCTSSASDYVSLALNPAIDDLSYVWNATVGNEELFGFPNLASTPASISCVAYKARVKRSDSGSRSVDVRCASGAADTAGTAAGVTPSSSFAWIGNYVALDPNTGVAWTGSAVNAATGGVKVAS